MKTPRFHICLAVGLGVIFSGCSRESKIERLLRRADEYVQANKYDSALIEYQNVLQLQPDHEMALQGLGRIWMERGAPMRAAPYIQKLRSMDPHQRDATLKSLQIALAAGRLEEARKTAKELLALVPNHPDAIVVLTDIVRGKDDLAQAQEALKVYSDRGSPAFHLASANLAFHAGDITAARIALQRAVGSDPKSVDARMAMGNFHWMRKDIAAAGEYLKAAAELAPPRSNARVKYLEFKSQTGAVAEAIAGFEKLTAEAPDFFPAWRGLAQISVARGDFEQANAQLGKIFAIDHWNYESRLLQARFLRARGEVDKAIAALDQLAAKFPELSDPHRELGQAYLQKKEVVKAETALRNAIARNPDDDTAVLLWAGLRLRAGDPQAVVIAMGDLLAKRPSLEAAQVLLIDALGAAGRLDDIITLIRESLRLNPEKPQPHYLLGLVLLRKGKFAEARLGFERTLELAPNFHPALAELVNLDLREGRADAGRARVEHGLEKNPESGLLHVLAARVAASQRRWDDAEASAWKAVSLGKGDLDVHDLIARSYIARFGSDTAAGIERLLVNRANDASALVVAGAVYLQQKEHAKAAEAYERCLKIRPDTITALNNLAYLYSARLNKPERGFELASKARELDPNSPDVADTLGWILFNRGEYARALELLTESVARTPANPEVQFHFARASQMMGKFDQARAAFQKAAESSAEFDGKSEIKEHLQQIAQGPGAR